MGQLFSGMIQTGFNLITLYGTAAQTGISGAYGSLQDVTENVGKGFALRTKTDALKQNILNGELDAARREAAGEFVVRKANGQPFDHVTELRDAQNGLLKRIRNIKIDLGNPTLDPATRNALERELSEASKLLDKTEEFLPR